MQEYDLKNKKIALLGFGKSNSELLGYIHKYTDDISIFDESPHDLKLEGRFRDIKVYSGSESFKNLVGFDYIFRSPGIRPDKEYIIEEVKKGAVLTSEIELFISLCRGWIIGVTGSDGKTTTASLIFDMIKRAGKKVYLGGNIGNPLINLLDQIDRETYVVLELSSFQLMTFTQSVDIAVITNISPNHLDYHTSYEEYIEAKKNLVRYAAKGSVVVLNAKDREVKKHFMSKIPITVPYNSKNSIYFSKGKIYFNDDEIIDTSLMLIKGRHNIDNLMAAMGAALEIVDFEIMRQTAESFPGVEHRIETVCKVEGVTYINDSIASSPKRTIAGLRSFDQKVILIAGGKDKGISFDGLGKEVKKYVKSIVLIGQTKDAILNSVLGADPDFDYRIADTLRDAVNIAHALAVDGDIVFFSPASTSFDMFRNFEDRGRQFKKFVDLLKGG